jgi:queuine tRNA-ribosyltransferase
VVETPVFLNVATAAAIKGAVSCEDLAGLKCQVALCNTYHLHLRPGDHVVRALGGIRPFMGWAGPVLTDSGGFQIFSLASLRKIKEEGVLFSSHVDGRKIFMGPEESMGIQSNIGSTIAMALDECVPYPATREYMQASVDRTTRWLLRCQAALGRLNGQGPPNPGQLLFGINQGGVFGDIRVAHAKQIAALGLPGYAIGGLAVGETHGEMYRVLEEVVPHLPVEKPTYLMGVGTPENILEDIARGVDFFDCVMPARNGRHGHLFTNQGRMNLFNARYERDPLPPDPSCGCPTCRRYSRAYLRHLLKAGELLALRLCVLHNLYFYNTLMEEARSALANGCYKSYMDRKLEGLRGR